MSLTACTRSAWRKADSDEAVEPAAIVCQTKKGRGVSFMEDDNNWHYRSPTTEEVLLAHRELGLA